MSEFHERFPPTHPAAPHPQAGRGGGPQREDKDKPDSGAPALLRFKVILKKPNRCKHRGGNSWGAERKIREATGEDLF